MLTRTKMSNIAYADNNLSYELTDRRSQNKDSIVIFLISFEEAEEV